MCPYILFIGVREWLHFLSFLSLALVREQENNFGGKVKYAKSI